MSIQIKGVREGLLITLGDGEWPALQDALLTQIVEQSSFFAGAKIALDVGNHILRAAEMGTLRDKLSDRGVALWAMLSNSPTTEQNAQVLGLATRLSTPRSDRVVRKLDTNLNGEEAVLVRRTLRSGFRLVSEGHVVVIGDVNPGAEIEANGDVVIWGRLRGAVHAGANGNRGCVVCAIEFAPLALRIAGMELGALQKKRNYQPEMAAIKNDQIILEPWSTK